MIGFILNQCNCFKGNHMNWYIGKDVNRLELISFY